MALPYLKPGVTVSEIISPALSPILLDPNVIGIVGPAQGFEEHVEFVVLDDNTAVTLQANNPDPSTIVVRDASNVTLTPFEKTVPGDDADYDVDTSDLVLLGVVRVTRTMQTTIPNGSEVVVYFENDASPVQSDGKTNFLVLNRLVGLIPDDAASATEAASILVQSEGLAPSGDYTILNEGSASPVPTIAWQNTATVIGQFQLVWLDYVIGSTQFTDQPVQLNSTTPVALPASADDIVVKNAPGIASDADDAVLYELGTVEDLDYMITGTGATTRIRRSQGTTTIGGANDKLVVRISYRATPSNYWDATRCFSQSDVEDKFGPSFDSTGNIANPLSFACLLAFQNGATQIVAQALFTDGTPRSQPSGALANWTDTLESLRVVDDITVLVPILAAGDLSTPTTDALNLEILQAVQSHCHYMSAQENKFPIAICGEDGTDGVLASQATLQDHAQALSSGIPAESTVLLSPSSFTFPNPVTGSNSDLGGQYVAAALAGMLARYPVQMPLTRKRINALSSLKVARTETQKDQDAGAGLLVVENKRGRIQVRHAITTAQDTRAHQELSVIRARNWMLTNLVEALDTQAIGQLVLDPSAAFLIQVLLTSELQLLIDRGTIVSYNNIQVRPDPNDPTTLQVRFSYLPAYPLNHIAISFSIDASQGVSFDQSTTTQGF